MKKGAIAQKSKIFICEGGKGCKSPTEAYGQEHLPFRSKERTPLRDSIYYPYQQTAGDIYKKCTVRKNNLQIILDKPGSQESGNAAEKPSRSNK